MPEVPSSGDWRCELRDHIWSAHQGSISDTNLARLEFLVQSNHEARRQYVYYLGLLADLQFDLSFPFEEETLFPGAIDECTAIDTTLMLSEGTVIADFLTEPSLVHRGSLPRRRLEVSRRLIGWTASLLLVGYFVAVTGLLIWDKILADQHEKLAKQTPNKPLARLAYSDDASWKHVPVDSLQNRTLQVQSGSAELIFDGGATVIVEGPAEFEVRSPNSGFLHHGKIAAHVPSRAVGFEVETPTARIVDRGTEFELDVTSRETRLAVIVGWVDLFPANDPGDGREQFARQARRVIAGQAVTIKEEADGAAAVRMIDRTSSWLSKTTRDPRQSLHSSQVVAYQLAKNSRGNRRDFYGGVGLDFEVRVPIRVYSLGVFDHLGDGIDPETSPIVQLWSRKTGNAIHETGENAGLTLQASQEFSTREPGELKAGHRFKPLPRPVELPVGSYSIVAYGLSDLNPFIKFDGAESDVEFSSRPNWTGSNNTTKGNNYGWSSSTSHAGGAKGEMGGTFARNHRESFYGDVHLTRTLTLDDAISASGSFTLRDVMTMDGQVFIGHYSSSTADDRREFIGMEVKEGDYSGAVDIRARLYRPNGTAGDGTISFTGMRLRMAPSPYHFNYTYDPTFEADGNHAGPEGKITLRIYNDTLSFDKTVTAVLESYHRDCGAAFDAFGVGIAAGSVKNDDPNRTAELFIDNVSYSGLRADVSSKPAAIATEELSAQMRVETLQGTIVPIGSRMGECKPGTFPTMQSNTKTDFAAGSFEYGPRTENSKERAVSSGQ